MSEVHIDAAQRGKNGAGTPDTFLKEPTMPVRPGNPISDRNMAGVKYKSDRPEDATAVVSGDINRPEGEGLAQDAPVGDNADAVTVEDGKPNRSDSKGEWEAYARSQGLDPEGMTKDELIDAIG